MKVGGEGKRGGLLVGDPSSSPSNMNVLQLLVNIKDDDPSYDSKNLDVLKRLRESNLLCEEDIQQYDLLGWACHPTSNARFEYLDPEALKDCKHTGYPLILTAAGGGIEHFVMTLKAGMKHFSEELGFLLELKWLQIQI